MTGQTDSIDPRGLIRESYRIEGITGEECRSIFLDWAISVPVDVDASDHVRLLLERHSSDAPDHPMTEVLRQGQTTLARPRRRGGWRSRPRN